jgi:bacterioferritin-associated ferredoxin
MTTIVSSVTSANRYPFRIFIILIKRGVETMSKICLCRGITEEKIIKAVKAGARTYYDIKVETGAGTGGCNGDRCKCGIEKLIKENK